MPAEKARPAPVMMTARTPGSATASSRAADISCWTVGLMAFITCGRFSVINPAAPRLSYRISV